MTSSAVLTMNQSIGLQTKKILLTGARTFCALELARDFGRAGHQVYLADSTTFHVAFFSNTVKKFHKTPSPRFETEEYIKTLSDIILKEEIDLLIPIWEEGMYISHYIHQLPNRCEVFCAPFSLLKQLHHKWDFIKLLNSLEFKTPRSVLLRKQSDLNDFAFETPYILKKCYSRGARFVIKVDTPKLPTIKIEEGNPWIAQEYLTGEHYCSYSVCSLGQVLAHAAYPVQYTMDGSSCLVFEAIEHPGVFEWVKKFVTKTGYTGQIAFDFIQTDEQSLYAIECNPRATGGIHLFHEKDHLERAFLRETQTVIHPKPGNRQQIAAGMLLYGLARGARTHFGSYLSKFFTTKDVIFNYWDIKPFLSEPIILTSYWLRSKQMKMSIPDYFTYDSEWNDDVRDDALGLKQ